MVKRFVALIIIMASIFTFASCGSNVGAEQETYKYAYVRMFDGSIVEGVCESEYAYSSGNVRVKIDGVNYKTHFSNIIIEERIEQ